MFPESLQENELGVLLSKKVCGEFRCCQLGQWLQEMELCDLPAGSPASTSWLCKT